MKKLADESATLSAAQDGLMDHTLLLHSNAQTRLRPSTSNEFEESQPETSGGVASAKRCLTSFFTRYENTLHMIVGVRPAPPRLALLDLTKMNACIKYLLGVDGVRGARFTN